MNRQRHQPREVVIVPMEFTPVELKFRNFAFARFQFPIRLAFAMTCNKAQGQTIPRCGVILRTPCFAHGQLYVAFSRVEAPENLWIYNSARDRTRTQNVVYKKVLRYQSADPLPLEVSFENLSHFILSFFSLHDVVMRQFSTLWSQRATTAAMEKSVN